MATADNSWERSPVVVVRAMDSGRRPLGGSPLRSLLALFAALFLLVTLTLGIAIRPAEARERGFEGRVIHVLNAVRAHHGLPRLVPCGRLSLAARLHSADLAQRGLLAHESSDGTPMDLRVRRFLPAANAVGETI